MSRFSVATLCLLVLGFIPQPASADPTNVGLTDSTTAAPGILNDSEKLGRAAQRELARLGCFSGNVDESWGREGRAAVKRLNQVGQIAWPDWPTTDLVSSLRNYADGYCQKCRGDDACATASTEVAKSPVADPVAKPPVAAKVEKPAAPVAITQKPLVAPHADKTAAVAHVDNHEQAPPPARPRMAKTEPSEVPEVRTEKNITLLKEENAPAAPVVPLPTRKPLIPKVDEASTSQPTPVPPEQIVSAVAAPSPTPEPPPATPPQQSQGNSSGGGWSNAGPNLDGR